LFFEPKKAKAAKAAIIPKPATAEPPISTACHTYKNKQKVYVFFFVTISIVINIV